VHAVMSLAMLLMYWFPRGTLSHSMSMTTAAGGARMDPGLAFLIAFVLFGSAVFTVASPNRGATHFGTHCADPVPVPVADGQHVDVTLVEAPLAPSGVLRAIAAPTLLDATHVVMSISMGLMLILMI